MPAKSIFQRTGAVVAYVTLNSELDNIASGISDEVAEIMREKTEDVANAARQAVPRNTGNLADSIEVVESNLRGQRGYRVVADARSTSGKYEVPYAHMVEYGSVHNNPPKPFLGPALDERREEIEKAVDAKLKEMVEG
jgi:HK97 gp10 family phage protein